MSDTVTRAFVGLGSNLSNPLIQVQTGVEELGRLPESHLCGASSMYRSPPLGPSDQPDYINAVAAVDTRLDAHRLLDHLQRLEDGHDRVRAERWGPRTLDLDLLLFGDQVIRSERLLVPHPQIRHRAFVLIPLQELAPDLVLPGVGPVSVLAAQLGNCDIEKVGDQTHA